MATERTMQPGGLLNCMKMGWISKKQSTKCTEGYRLSSPPEELQQSTSLHIRMENFIQ